MQIALIGLANSGRTTLFNALSGLELPTHPFPTTEGEPHHAVVQVPDGRMETLAGLDPPRQAVHATVEYIDPVGLIQGDPVQNQRVVAAVKDADALLLVLRAFEDDGVLHPLETVDPVRDSQILEEELILTDLLLVETRLRRMEQDRRKGKHPDEHEQKALEHCRGILEPAQALRHTPMDEETRRALQHLEFVSSKPVMIVLNVGEDELGDAGVSPAEEALRQRIDEYPELNRPALQICSAKIEMEIEQLEPDEAAAFDGDLGLEEPARVRLIRASHELLGLITFLTMNEAEVRAWTIPQGTPAVKAAGKVHSDMERGFIRAEVVTVEDFVEAGGDMAALRKAAAVRQEGKTYEVQDGDIIHFKFNV